MIDHSDTAPSGRPSSADTAELRRDCEALRDELAETRRREAAALDTSIRWRAEAVRSWAQAASGTADRRELVEARARAEYLAAELERHRATLSWRVTAPLRRVRRLSPRPPSA